MSEMKQGIRRKWGTRIGAVAAAATAVMALAGFFATATGWAGDPAAAVGWLALAVVSIHNFDHLMDKL